MRIEPRPPEPRLPNRAAAFTHEALEGHDVDSRGQVQPEQQSQVRLNDSERESLLLNIDVSLRVQTRPQLFSWVQRALQSMMPH